MDKIELALGAERLEIGRRHPTIEMNLANLATCQKHCGSCPSYPGRRDEALFCASGASGEAKIQEKGCNCLVCPLYERCGADAGAYFCKYGASDPLNDAAPQEDYLDRFVQSDGDAPPEVVELGVVSPLELQFEDNRVIEATSDRSILQCAIDAGVTLTHVCGGRALCSTCRVLVLDGEENLLPRNAEERELASAKGFSPQVRLACQTRAHGKVRLRRLVLDKEDASAAIHQGRYTAGAVGKDVNAAIMFSDIRAFTTFSEHTLPYDLVHILNRYFESVGKIVDRHGGYIDKYMGDGIMVVFGLDALSRQNPSLHAARAGLQMLDNLNAFNPFLRERFDHEFSIGVGICTGTAVVGSLGFHKKREFTAIGDTVNTASRIESLTKVCKRPLLVCENTYAAIRDDFSWDGEFCEPVRGKSLELRVHAIDPTAQRQ